MSLPQRYFLEVAYKGTAYSGFQRQENAGSIQEEIEKAFAIVHRHAVQLTGASRTDTGVHALQNYFHFDYAGMIHPQFLYKLNAVLPYDIVIAAISKVAPDAHSRFDAVSRSYRYQVYQHKDPFLQDRAYYFPYKLDVDKLNEAAAIFPGYTDYTSFSKRNTQVKTFTCTIQQSEWKMEKDLLVYYVTANRFLRGMVRGLTGTMLLAGRGRIPVAELHSIISARDCSRANFAVPAHGLFLVKVTYPAGVLQQQDNPGK
jgi:tRNA pseudouridine38-40 synthase